MRLQTANLRARYTQIGVPAAILGTLASTLTASPAAAETPTATSRGAVERSTGSARIVPATTAPATYTVRAGDTVSSIAAAFGLRTVDVLTWNGLGWRSVIYPGQTLRLAAAAAPAAPAAPTASATHTVVAGDTVFGIAQKHGTTVDAVLAANGLDRTSIIYPGQQLAVAGAPATAPPVAAPSTPPAAAPPANTPPASATTHTVVAGDTIFGIAERYGTSVAAVLAANGLTSASIIYPGQRISVSAAVPASVGSTTSTALDAEQADNARLIIRIGRELGVSDRGIAIALATAMVESWIRNLDWGDRDSLGIFQQRPSTGWGTPEQIRDRERSIRVFFGGPHDPNGAATRGLLDIPGWETMSFSAAAQAVQISAFPGRYAQWEAQAYQWLALYG